jgi:hypothetical protein
MEVMDRAVEANPETPIMLVGYSQGGLDALNVADQRADQYPYVTTVVAFATPIVKSEPFNYYNLVYLTDENDSIVRDWSVPDYAFDQEDAGNLYVGISGVTGDVHGDPATYEIIGTQFDEVATSYPNMQADLATFQGTVTQTWT